MLATHPAVESCTVVVRRNAAGEPALIAYFVSAAGQESVSAVLRAHLGRQILGAMIPPVSWSSTGCR